ncbi:MAG: ADP-glyceromanno-heptose 6-epimerase [Arsenophonus sp.]|nr:MAG: ADP-glyceromanno-heptose 6-epimerase [Arsenophonus sp.]
MILVTGGAGFIGNNLIKKLNQKGYDNILVIDNLKKSYKFHNLINCKIMDFLDKKKFLFNILEKKYLPNIKVIFHQGACTITTKSNGTYMMNNNYEYSKILLTYAVENNIPFLYASSAAVYGNSKKKLIEDNQNEKPLNIYGYSKLLFDQYVIKTIPKSKSQICGLRYFNVYGPYENHKKNMASIIFQINQSINYENKIKLFKNSHIFKRDFIYIDDVISVNLWCWKKKISGIFNCGTGKAQSIENIAKIIKKIYNKKNISIEYFPIPKNLKKTYQIFTKANLNKLRHIGYSKPFKKIEQGIIEYIQWLNKKKHENISY